MSAPNISLTKGPSDEDIRNLVKSGHALSIAFAKAEALRIASDDAQRELEDARRIAADAARGIWLRVSVEDKARVLTELWPLYSATWSALSDVAAVGLS